MALPRFPKQATRWLTKWTGTSAVHECLKHLNTGELLPPVAIPDSDHPTPIFCNQSKYSNSTNPSNNYEYRLDKKKNQIQTWHHFQQEEAGQRCAHSGSSLTTKILTISHQVTTNEELQETAGPVYGDSLAAESQANNGSFADGEAQDTKKPLKQLETSNDAPSNANVSREHTKTANCGKEEKTSGAKDEKTGEVGATHQSSKSSPSEHTSVHASPASETLQHEKKHDDHPESGKGVVEHAHHSGAPGPTGTAPGEPIESPESAQHGSSEKSHDGPETISHRQHGHKDQTEARTHEETSSGGQSPENHHEKHDSQKQSDHSQAPISSNTENETPLQGKGIPEHSHHSLAAAPGPTGTAPGEPIESTPSHQDQHHDHASPQSATTDAPKSNSIREKESHNNTSSSKDAAKDIKSISSAHQEATSQDNLSPETGIGKTGSSHDEDKTQGKGIPEHPHHSQAAAPGPTGTAPGEPVRSVSPQPQDHHQRSSSRKSHTEKDNASIEQSDHQKGSLSAKTKTNDTDSSTHEDQTQGKGIPEHPHHSEAAAPGPTGTAPGEPLEDHNKNESSPNEEKKETGSSPKRDDGTQRSSSNDADKFEQTERTAKHATHTSGKGVPEQKHHFDSGAPGPTGTAPGEALQAAQKDDSEHSSPKEHHDNFAIAKEDKISTQTKENDGTNQEKKTRLAPPTKHEKHDSHHDISLSEEKHTEHHHSGHEEHHEPPKAGKGIPELKHHFASGAPGATGTAPGEAMN
jgi:hypothetical protein